MTFKLSRRVALAGWLAVLVLVGPGRVWGAGGNSAGWRFLHGHVPAVVLGLAPKGTLAGTNVLQLAIGLPLRDPAGLSRFLADVYDPASPVYHQYLTPAQFTDRFGPTAADYAAVEQFARANGLVITQTHGNRLLLDVKARVADINRAFRITLRTYRHPKELRDFFAPDTEPMVGMQLPIADISGLSDFGRPKPMLHAFQRAAATPQAGSGPGSSYQGSDFRAAYVPGTTLDGTGQQIGLLEFDGYYDYDIGYYESQSGLRNIPVQPVLLDGVSGVPGFSAIPDANGEVSLDIELAMAMAPGLSQVVVFEGSQPNDILNAMAASNQVNQFSSSWQWGGVPYTTMDAIFQEMAAQGQSYFNASGDYLAYTPGANSTNGLDNPLLSHDPSSSPYITVVGGTTLSTTGPGGSYTGETVWNSGAAGSSGGVSSQYPIPPWQAGVNFATNGGVATQRNIPDVALAGDNIQVYFGDGQESAFAGTSCATPLWAGFTALANQAAAAQGSAPMGFLNPALYAVAGSAANAAQYAAYFNDVTNGNNEWPASPSQYVAVPGYDLCTGLGTPAGTNLIHALLGREDSLHVAPGEAVMLVGASGGPFSPGQVTYALTNHGATTLSWSISGTPAWLNLRDNHGTLGPLAQTNLTFGLNAAATNLADGTYTVTLTFSNATSHLAQNRWLTLQVIPELQAALAGGFSPAGAYGGPFTPAIALLTVSNYGSAPLNWSLVNTSAWLTASPDQGTVPAGGPPAEVALGLAPAAASLTPGIYPVTLLVSNNASRAVQSFAVSLAVGRNLVANGGFESGDFTGWLLTGDSIYPSSPPSYPAPSYFNAVVSSTTFVGASDFIHSGSYGAILGESGYLATLDQTLATAPGQVYLLSGWLLNDTNQPTVQFQINWGGATVYNVLNPPVFGWTNLQFLVTAAAPATLLEFAAENDNGYFGLDDITLIPVPNPGFASSSASGQSFQLNWSTSPGLSYQLQFKTNLLQPAWINLGSSRVAAGNGLTFSDTNTFLNSPQRFYRLLLAP